MKSLSKLLVAIVMIGTMGSASATLLSFGINLSGSVTLTPAGDIQAGTTTKTINPAGTTSSCTGDAGACVAAGIPTGGGTPATFSVSVLPTKIVAMAPFTVSTGNIVATFTNISQSTIVATTATVAGSISLQFNGTITGGSGPASIFLGQTISLSETCTQTGPGAVITCSESLRTPGLPQQTPEPMSLALVGVGLLALGFTHRRKSS